MVADSEQGCKGKRKSQAWEDVSHARRFGKSQAAGMLDAYYSLGSDSRELFAPFRIAENNGFIVDLQADRLLERILHRDNMNNAYFSVKANKGVGGVDRMSVDELLPYLKENKDTLLSELWLGKYKPQPVRRVEIPKEEKGKVRKLMRETNGGVLTGDIQERYDLYNAYFNSCHEGGQQDG